MRNRLAILVVALIVIAGCGSEVATSSPSAPVSSETPEASSGEPVGPAAWWLDPDAPAPGPDATVIPALIREQACASGATPEGRVLPPEIYYATGAILVIVKVRHRPGGQDCQGNPAFPIEIQLAEPLGERKLLDGSEQPPRDATVPAQ